MIKKSFTLCCSIFLSSILLISCSKITNTTITPNGNPNLKTFSYSDYNKINENNLKQLEEIFKSKSNPNEIEISKTYSHDNLFQFSITGFNLEGLSKKCRTSVEVSASPTPNNSHIKNTRLIVEVNSQSPSSFDSLNKIFKTISPENITTNNDFEKFYTEYTKQTNITQNLNDGQVITSFIETPSSQYSKYKFTIDYKTEETLENYVYTNEIICVQKTKEINSEKKYTLDKLDSICKANNINSSIVNKDNETRYSFKLPHGNDTMSNSRYSYISTISNDKSQPSQYILRYEDDQESGNKLKPKEEYLSKFTDIMSIDKAEFADHLNKFYNLVNSSNNNLYSDWNYTYITTDSRIVQFKCLKALNDGNHLTISIITNYK